ncbi:MAG: alpha-L-glutamate ligase [Kiloniellales bacterium]|nr:alpha-L-glutamate ligase [Kiloniellales bacterium]
MMSRIHVLHENSAWVEPLRSAFDELGLPHEEWFLDEGTIAFDREPPAGVFYNRMSASSHTRGHRYAPELTHGVLNWLEGYGRRVVNNHRALYLEVSKLAQYAALGRAGIETPRTVAAVGREKVIEAARAFGDGPFILKPNRGGKGLGVQLFQSVEAMTGYLDGPGAGEEAPIDGVWLIQDYIRPPASFITRCEFVGGRFLYAVKVDTSDGFELCPADACNIEDAFCPAEAPPSNKFSIIRDFDHQIIESYARFLRENGIEIAGIEFIRDAEGRLFTYDVNTNTNYNAQAEADARVPVTGMQAVARFLGEELAKLRATAGAVAAE